MRTQHRKTIPCYSHSRRWMALLLVPGLTGRAMLPLFAAAGSIHDDGRAAKQSTERRRDISIPGTPIADLEQETTDELLDLLTSPDPRVRAPATEILIRRGEPVVEPMLNRLRKIAVAGCSSPATFHLEKALVRLGTAAVPALREARNDSNEHVRASANRLLVKIGDEATQNALIAQLQDADAGVREAAAWALAEGDYAAVAPPFVALLSHEDAKFRRMAAWVLGRLRDERAVPSLQEALSDPEREVREKAAWALGYIGKPEASEALLTAFEAHEFDFARRILGNLQDRQVRAAVPRLAEWLRDEQVPENVRRNIASSLGWIGGAAARAALREELAKKELTFRYECAEALARLGDRRATPFLLEQLRSRDYRARNDLWMDERWMKLRLMGDLGRTRDPRAIPALLEILQCKDEHLQNRASESLRRITGLDCGFYCKTSSEDQARAVQRWLEWWNNGQPQQAWPHWPHRATVQAVCQVMLQHLSQDGTITTDLRDKPAMAVSTRNLPTKLQLSFPGKDTLLLDREDIRDLVAEWGELPFVEFESVRIACGMAEVQCECLLARPDGFWGLVGTQVLLVKQRKGWRLKEVLGWHVA